MAAPDPGPVVVARAQGELASEEARGSDLLTKVVILTALAGIELTGGFGIVATEPHSHLPLQHDQVSIPIVGTIGLGTLMLAVLIVLYALVIAGAGAGLVALIARRYTGKRSSDARIERIETYTRQLRDPPDLVYASQIAEIQLLVAAHVGANDRRDRLLRWLVTPAVIIGILSTAGVAALLGVGPVRPTDVRVVSASTATAPTTPTISP